MSLYPYPIAHLKPAASGPAPLAQDDFSGTLSNWAQDAGTWSTTGGQLQCSSAGSTAVLRWTGGGVSVDDYAVECDILVVDGALPANLGVRCTAGLNGYFARISRNLNNIQIERMAGGGYTMIAGPIAAPSAGWHTFRLEVEGAALRLYQDGVLILPGTDAALASGQPMLHAYSPSADARWDNFKVYAL